MASLTERHEVKIRGKDKTIIFSADSEDGRLIISQVPDGKRSKEVCSISLSTPDELRDFFRGLQRIVASLEHGTDVIERGREDAAEQAAPAPPATRSKPSEEDREAVIAQARQRNAQAFTPWSRKEEQEIRERFERGENIQQIASAHKRSPRAIELRLTRLGLLAPQDEHTG